MVLGWSLTGPKRDQEDDSAGECRWSRDAWLQRSQKITPANRHFRALFFFFSSSCHPVPETPQTPGVFFALRAFKDAFLGSPSQQSDLENVTTTSSIDHYQYDPSQAQKNSQTQIPTISTTFSKPLDTSNQQQAGVSPTKSILLTPGVPTNRRKSVTFGDGTKPRTSPLFNNNNNNNENSSTDQSSRAPNQFLQKLLEVRNSPVDMNENFYDVAPKRNDDALKRQHAADEQQTVNLSNEPTGLQTDAEATDFVHPHSQSGVFWKTQFESFKATSTSQIRSLIDQMQEARDEARLLKTTLDTRDVQVDNLREQVSQLQDTLRRERENHTELKRTLKLEKDKAPPAEVHEELRYGERGAESWAEKRNAEDDEVALLRARLGLSRERVSQLEEENLHFKQSLAKIKKEIHDKAAIYEPQRLRRENALKKRETYLQEVAQRYRQNYKDATQQRDETQLAMEDLQRDKSDLEAEVQSLRRKLGIFSLSTGVVSAQDMSETIQDHHHPGSKAYLQPDDFTMTQDITAQDFLS